MQAIILAAGIGRRLGKITRDIPKCMVPINGTPIIESAVKNLLKAGIEDIILVVGHGKEVLINFLKERFPKANFEFVENTDYSRTNNIYSLYLARDFFGRDDTVLLESDILFEFEVLERLLADRREVLAVVDKYKSWMEGTVVKLDEEDNITAFIPKEFFDYRELDEYYKTVNIYRFSAEYMKDVYLPFLEAYIKVLGRNEYYELVLRVISSLERANIKALKLQREKWYEIDTTEDIRNAECVFAPDPETKLRCLSSRHGGFWRFPYVKDFCYLVNPFFPHKQLTTQLQVNFPTLMANYPSTLKVINHTAGALFGIDENCVIVANGASELIYALSDTLPITVGIALPTFNEYIEKFRNVVALETYHSNYAYGVQDLFQLSEKADAILLINPDNPSGHYIKKEEVLALLKELKKRDRLLILDESFVDFADEEGSLIDEEILEEYKNLCIIKSLGKSYGVAGIRLGVLVSSNREIVNRVKERLPIWNISSPAEFFLQIMDKNKKEYAIACERLRKERERLFNKLKEIDFLNPLPSQANFFMCEVLPPFTASELTRELPWRFNILIKDLTGKPGIGGEYVRIAVKTPEDNDTLIEHLKQL